MQENMELTLHPTNEVSIYKGPLNEKIVIENIARVQRAFPNLPLGFYDIFDDRLRANGFTNERLIAAVNYVIDNVRYPIPTIADFISYNKTYTIYTYEDMLRKAYEFGQDIWNNYNALKMKCRAKKVWVHVNDIKQYNLIDDI
jgi:hypothetical protein